MRIRTKLKRLKNPDPKFVSLVARGANHIPFRILKSDEGNAMIDLTKLSRVFKTNNETPPAKTDDVATAPVVEVDDALVEPEVRGVVVMKGDDAAKAKVEAAGFNVAASTENEDGSVMFTQGEVGAATAILKSGDVVFVTDALPSEAAEAMAPFEARVGVDGFHLGLGEACGALHAAFTDVIQKADSPEAAIAGVNAVMDEFNAYVDGLTEGLPLTVFKGDLLTAMAPAEVVTKADGKCGKCGGSMVCKSDCGKEAVAKADDVAPVPPVEKPAEVVTAVVEAPPVQSAATPAESVQKTDDKADKLLAAIESVATVQKSQSEALAAMAKRQDEIEATVKESVTKADATIRKINSTVAAAPIPAENPAGEQVVKSDSGFGGGYFDTAMDRRRNRR